MADVRRQCAEPDLRQRLPEIFAYPGHPRQQPVEPEIAELGCDMNEDEEDDSEADELKALAPAHARKCSLEPMNRGIQGGVAKHARGLPASASGGGNGLDGAPRPLSVYFLPRRSWASWFRRS